MSHLQSLTLKGTRPVVNPDGFDNPSGLVYKSSSGWRMYGRVDERFLARLGEALGPAGVITDPERLAAYSHDEYSLRDIARSPEVVARPDGTAEVAAVLKLAAEARIPVTPRGGATGLCGGCVPVSGGLVLSLERLNGPVEVDVPNQMAVAEAGVTLGEFGRAAEEAGLYFPPHPGDEGAMIGGLLATNAGGSRAVKYGVIRNYVRGMEVVLAGGEVLHLGGKVIKSSMGYNLLHLFVGSEGTLGVITRATLQLMARPAALRTLVVPFATPEAAIEAVPALLRQGIVPVAVEFLGLDVIGITEAHLSRRWPTHDGTTHLFVILDAESQAEIDRLSEAVAAVCLDGGAIDVYIADTAAKQAEVLAIRSQIYDALKPATVEILDIAVPRAEIAGHVRAVEAAAAAHDVWLPTFGHAGDGNVHTHLMKVRWDEGRLTALPEAEWREKLDRVREELFRDGLARGGVISGEHGIGLVKKPYFDLAVEAGQIERMRAVKRAFDPLGILNPGKIFPDHS